MCDRKEIESLKERIRAEGCNNWEPEHKLKTLERKFGSKKALVERQTYQA